MEEVGRNELTVNMDMTEDSQEKYAPARLQPSVQTTDASMRNH